MILRGTNFGLAWLGAGAGGFFGEAYRFHPYFRALFPNGFCPEDFTFVAKTTTLGSRRGVKYGEKGNMELRADFTPEDLMPDCIIADPRHVWRGEMLNAVGLSGPGAEPLFDRGEWQSRKKPFFISFMSMEEGDKALQEMESFATLLQFHLSEFSAPIGLQINLSCPNAGVNLQTAAKKAQEALDVFASLGIPLVPKFNLLTPVEVVKMVALHPACDAIQVSNTIPYGKDERVDWWQGKVSPLEKYGGGGLSGAQLLPLVCDWIRQAKNAGIRVPINAGGGILCARDVDRIKASGADGISIATAVALRPWKVRSILERAHKVFPT